MDSMERTDETDVMDLMEMMDETDGRRMKVCHHYYCWHCCCHRT